MHTVSSASRTFIACESAVEWTATVLIPISWQARLMRSAISPRLAISTFSNIAEAIRRSLDQHQRGAVFYGLAILGKNAGNPSDPGGADLVHHLHRLDDQQRLALADRIADADKRRRPRLRREIGDADDRRGDGAGMVDGRCRRGLDRRARLGLSRRRGRMPVWHRRDAARR